MTAIAEWLHRCAAAHTAGQPVPEAQLFRRMLSHDEYFCAGAGPEDATIVGGPESAADIYCSSELARAQPGGGGELVQLNGLQLTAAIAAGTRELRLFFDAAAAPYVLDQTQVLHFCSLLRVTVVEQARPILDELFSLHTFLRGKSACASPPRSGARAPLRWRGAPGRAALCPAARIRWLPYCVRQRPQPAACRR